jgi:histidinol-phosphate aminotransferase
MVHPTKLVNSLRTDSAFPGVATLERERGRPYKARLGSNECLFGTSPAAFQAAEAAKETLAYYNDPACFDLIQAIGRSEDLDPESILVDVGIDGLLGLFVRGFLEPGSAAITTRGSYPTFNYHVRGYGGRLVEIPYEESFHTGLNGMRDAAHSNQARVCYVSNPDNPTGTFLPKQELAQFINEIPDDCLILLDEAYIEFVPGSLVLPMDFTRPNLVRLRTFSKAYGLASARVGYAICDPAIVRAMNRIRLHFGVGALSQIMARAVLDDRAFLAGVIAATEEGKSDLETIARALSIDCIPSYANFIALDFETPERAKKVAAVLEEFDIFVRRPPELDTGRLIRVTIGPKPLREIFSSALQEAVQRA